LRHRQFPLGFRLRPDQIRKPFSLRQIDLAIYECATGKLACFSHPAVCEPGQFFKQALDHRAAAVKLELGAVFAGETRRSRKRYRQPPVYQITVSASNRS
jgi:hypothetical protein